MHLGLFFLVNNSLQLHAHCDTNWGFSTFDRKSLTRFCTMFGDSLVSRKYKKQNTVSTSTTEVEYRSMGSTNKELLWTSYILRDLHVAITLLVSLFCKSKYAFLVAHNPCSHGRTKNINIDTHFLRDHVTNGFLRPTYVSSSFQLTNIFTELSSTHHFCS